MAYQYKGTVFDAHLPLPATLREQAKIVPDCGTSAGYQAHRRFSEDVCDECQEARRDDQKARKLAKKAATA